MLYVLMHKILTTEHVQTMIFVAYHAVQIATAVQVLKC